MSLSLSTTRITNLPIDSSLQYEQTEPDQWQIAPNVSQIVNIVSDVPETDDTLPVPSSTHRGSLAPLISTSSSPLLLSASTTQEPVNEEPVLSTPPLTTTQSNATYVPNVTHIQSVNVKALKPNVVTVCPVSPVNGRMSRTHSTDNSNGKSARYRHGRARVISPSSRFRHNLPSSSRRRRGTYSFKSSRKKAVSLVRPRLVAVPNDNSKGKSSRFKLSRLSLQSRTISRVIARDLPSRLSSQVSRHFPGHIIECVLTPPTSHSHSLRPSCLFGHAIARVHHRLSLPLRLSTNTMTPSVSTGFQALCFLPEDPSQRRMYRRITLQGLQAS